MPNDPHDFQDIRDAIRDLCAQFPPEYFRKIDEERGYPEEFVNTLTEAGWLAALIPEEYGGSGLSLTAASVIMEEINRNGGNSGVCHGQMYNMGTLLRHGSQEQKQRYLPGIASGELRLQAFGVTEIVVKNGPNSALVAMSGQNETVPVPDVVVPVDPSAAGDAFNAAYLAARLSTHGAVDAVNAAHKLARDVIRHPGAIMPRAGAVVH